MTTIWNKTLLKLLSYPRVLNYRIRLRQESWESVSRVVCHMGTTCELL
jgi:hypothetical protein